MNVRGGSYLSYFYKSFKQRSNVKVCLILRSTGLLIANSNASSLYSVDNKYYKLNGNLNSTVTLNIPLSTFCRYLQLKLLLFRLSWIKAALKIDSSTPSGVFRSYYAINYCDYYPLSSNNANSIKLSKNPWLLNILIFRSRLINWSVHH